MKELITFNTVCLIYLSICIYNRFGKVLWDLPVVNSALIHPVKDLDKDGSVNLEKFIFADAQPDPKHNFSPG